MNVFVKNIVILIIACLMFWCFCLLKNEGAGPTVAEIKAALKESSLPVFFAPLRRGKIISPLF